MIAELNESNRPQFLAAVRGRPYFGDILPVHLAVFGRSGALMRFYVADGSAAVQLKGRSAVLCGRETCWKPPWCIPSWKCDG